MIRKKHYFYGNKNKNRNKRTKNRSRRTTWIVDCLELHMFILKQWIKFLANNPNNLFYCFLNN